MKKFILFIIAMLPLWATAETWDLPMGGGCSNGKISVSNEKMSLSWTNSAGNQVNYVFTNDSYRSAYVGLEHNKDGKTVKECDFFYAGNKNYFEYYDFGYTGYLIIRDLNDKSEDKNGKIIFEGGVKQEIFTNALKKAIRNGIFTNIGGSTF